MILLFNNNNSNQTNNQTQTHRHTDAQTQVEVENKEFYNNLPNEFLLFINKSKNSLNISNNHSIITQKSNRMRHTDRNTPLKNIHPIIPIEILTIKNKLLLIKNKSKYNLLLINNYNKIINKEFNYLKLLNINNYNTKNNNLFLTNILLNVNFWFRLSVVSSVVYVTAEVLQYPEKYNEMKDFVVTNIISFCDRRIIKPTHT